MEMLFLNALLEDGKDPPIRRCLIAMERRIGTSEGRRNSIGSSRSGRSRRPSGSRHFPFDPPDVPTHHPENQAAGGAEKPGTTAAAATLSAENSFVLPLLANDQLP